MILTGAILPERGPRREPPSTKEPKLTSIALHTRLLPDTVDTYESVHAVIPADLDAALRRAGVTGWRIWRDGLDLFHVVEVEDFDQMNALLEVEPADIAWQSRINALLHAAGRAATPLGLVWELPA